MFTIRPISASDNAAVAEIIRNVMTEFGASGPGFAIHDAEVDSMFETYAAAGSAYFVIEMNGRICGGGGSRRWWKKIKFANCAKCTFCRSCAASVPVARLLRNALAPRGAWVIGSAIWKHTPAWTPRSTCIQSTDSHAPPLRSATRATSVATDFICAIFESRFGVNLAARRRRRPPRFPDLSPRSATKSRERTTMRALATRSAHATQ